MVELCRKCGSDNTHRDSVDVGVGVIYGPLGCGDCLWSECPEYDLSDGQESITEGGYIKDPYGGLTPVNSFIAELEQ